MDLKERAIYQLPNGRELVARLTPGNRVVLYNLSASLPGRYELNSEGRLLLDGQLTAWETRDLFETGRIASADLTAILVEGSTPDRKTSHEQSA